MVVDAITVAGGLWFINQIRPLLGVWLSNWPFVKEFNQLTTLPVAMYIIFPLVWVALMSSFSIYDGRKNLTLTDEFTNLILSTLIAGITLAGILFLTYREVSRLMFVAFVIFVYFALIVWRGIIRTIYQYRNSARGKASRVLIIGAGPVGQEVGARITRQRYFNLELVGYLDDNVNKRSKQPEILAPLNEIREVVKKVHINNVVIALPSRAYETVNELVSTLFDLPVKVWIVPDYFQLTLHHAAIEDFAGIPMLDMRAPALTENQRMVKRIFDLLVTCLIMIPILPVMCITGLAIWLDDGRPILFQQKRVGENGHIFTMYKFRTMVKNAEDLRILVEQTDTNGNLLHKRPDDPRVTRLGQILRRLSLDELPQFFNVLRGTMSLVGPRPELPYLVNMYQPWQRKRFAVPQGITGWWQIHGRSNKPMHLHTEDDIYYIQHYSIWLDIQIIIRTVWKVPWGKGAF